MADEQKPVEPRDEGERKAKQEKQRPARFVEARPRQPSCCPR